MKRPPAKETQLEPTPSMDRHNGRLYILSNILVYLAAPVIYVGVVQAALCDKLSAGFPASFVFGLVTAALSLVLLLGLPRKAPHRPSL